MVKLKKTLISAGLILGLAALFSACFYFATQLQPEEFWGGLGYIGIFLLGFLGASSILIPLPYPVILLSIAPAFSPLPFALSAGLGSALGEGVGYALGYLGRGILGDKERRRLNAMRLIIQRYGPIAIFLFALTPLPDDLLFIPLGLMGYSFWRAMLACASGKFFMALILAYSGEAVREIFAIHWTLVPVVAIALAVAVFLTLRIDWTKFVPRGTRH
jgi:membrane protein YqaA with SNARE-associated domain